MFKVLLYFVGRCCPPLPPFPAFSPVLQPVPQSGAPSPQLRAGICPHPRPGGETPAGTPSHQLSGADGKGPHEMNIDFLVPQKSQSRGRSHFARGLPAAMAAFAEPDAAQAGIDAEVPNELGRSQHSAAPGIAGVSQELGGCYGAAFPCHARGARQPGPGQRAQSRLRFRKGRTALSSDSTPRSITASKVLANHLGSLFP